MSGSKNWDELGMGPLSANHEKMMKKWHSQHCWHSNLAALTNSEVGRIHQPLDDPPAIHNGVHQERGEISPPRNHPKKSRCPWSSLHFFPVETSVVSSCFLVKPMFSECFKAPFSDRAPATAPSSALPDLSVFPRCSHRFDKLREECHVGVAKKTLVV